MATDSSAPVGDDPITCLKATRAQVWRAERFLVVQFGLAFVSAAVLGPLGVFYDGLKIVAAIATIVIIILDVFLERIVDAGKREAARLQELYDCSVLGLPWSRLLAEDPPMRAMVLELEHEYDRVNRVPNRMVDWYPASLSVLPPHVHCLGCQYVTIWWNRLQQRALGRFYLAITVLMATLLLSPLGFNAGGHLILQLLAPTLPLVVLLSRIILEHVDSVDAYRRIEAFADETWCRAKSGASSDEIRGRSRMIQDELFNQRCRRPLVLERAYRGFYKRIKRQVDHNVAAFLRDWPTPMVIDTAPSPATAP